MKSKPTPIKPTIPDGWRKLGTNEKIKRGDLYGSVWYPAGQINRVVGTRTPYTYIRKILEK